MPARPQPPQDRRWKTPHVIFLWWLVLAALLIWNVMSVRSSQETAVKIPYSTFITQVTAGNVAKVSIAGEEIGGAFVKPIVWPRPASATPPSRTAESKAAGSKSPQPASQEPTGPRAYKDFVTIFPQSLGDPTLLPLLESHGVQVSAHTPPSPWLSNLFASLLPLLLLIGFFWWMGRRATKQQSSIFGFGRQQARRYDASQPGVTFGDVAGADVAKQQLREEVDFLRNPGKYHDLGARIPRGVLLVGPPGTGKTLLARAVAGEAKVPFFSISGSEFVEMFVGVGASRVRDLFKQAKEAAPAIVFIDELDAVGRRRGAGVGTVNDEREQTLNQLLVEMDGFDARQEVIILAATNRPDVLDPALLRPGRFDRQVVVGLPDRPGREGILRIHTRHLQLAQDVDLSVIAKSTIGMSGAQLANLCNEAALIAARQSHPKITMADFEAAMDKVVLGDAHPLVLDERARRVTAYHEGGHALVAWLTPEADPVHKVTIVPHGQALGATEQLPGEDRYSYSESYLKARLAVMLGGRVAEEIVIGDVTTGAENDLVQATRLARQMVIAWGMGSLGPAAYKDRGESPFLGYELAQGRDYSEATATLVDADVAKLLKERYEAVRRLLTEARSLLDRLAEALLGNEVVDHDELVRLLGPRPAAASDDATAGERTLLPAPAASATAPVG